MENKHRAVFESLFAQEGAVASAYGAAQEFCSPPLRDMLESLRQSHRGQMAAIARVLAAGGPPPASGAPSVPATDPRTGSWKEAMRALEQLEDGLVAAYQGARERMTYPYGKRIIEVDLLPAQLRSHEQMRQIERQGLEAPAWIRG